jgi:hypothetical protein
MGLTFREVSDINRTHWPCRRRRLAAGLARWANTWRCWSRGHRRGVEVGFGYCGKCVPCPRCGSETAGHYEGCRWE